MPDPAITNTCEITSKNGHCGFSISENWGEAGTAELGNISKVNPALFARNPAGDFRLRRLRVNAARDGRFQTIAFSWRHLQ
jgi:hypothetical protein